ncbi:MAG: hypothetical protein OHK0031_03180 [Anaerolineales bacterium]
MESLEFPHWDALTPATQQAYALISPLDFIAQYYLAGGTGLALHLGHRISVDLDLFSDHAEALDATQRHTLRALVEEPDLEIVYDKDGTFVVNWHGVGISFFRLNQYPLVKPTTLTNDIPLASLEEIGAMKLAAIIGRGTRKDLVDLYFILQHCKLETLFEVAAAKYARIHTFATSAVRALAYFDDAEALPMPRMIDKTPWTKMKKFLTQQALDAGRKQLSELWEN